MEDNKDYNGKYRDDYIDDPLMQSSYDKVTSKKIKDGIGILLILFGAVIASWIILSVSRLIYTPEKLPIYTKITSEIVETQVQKGEKNLKIVFPPKATAVFSVVAVLFIATMISATLITQGVNLMHFDMLKLHRKLDSLKLNINNKFNSIKQSFKG